MTWVSLAGAESWIDSDPGVIEIVGQDKSPWGERVAGVSAIDRIVHLTSTAAIAPSPVALLSAARVAAQRGRFRLALMEMGTALEAILTARLGLSPGHKQTLGPLTDSALKAGVPLRHDVKATFVQPRNDAVHNGIDPSATTVSSAFGLLTPLVEADYPDYAGVSTAAFAHRPQRFDLRIVQPGSATDQASQSNAREEPKALRRIRDLVRMVRGGQGAS